jgi:hypothetical protein
VQQAGVSVNEILYYIFIFLLFSVDNSSHEFCMVKLKSLNLFCCSDIKICYMKGFLVIDCLVHVVRLQRALYIYLMVDLVYLVIIPVCALSLMATF